MDDFKQFQDLCFLHACGRLSDEEAHWFATALAAHPEWQPEVDSANTLVQLSRTVQAMRQQALPPVMTFEQVMACLPDRAEVPVEGTERRSGPAGGAPLAKGSAVRALPNAVSPAASTAGAGGGRQKGLLPSRWIAAWQRGWQAGTVQGSGGWALAVLAVLALGLGVQTYRLEKVQANQAGGHGSAGAAGVDPTLYRSGVPDLAEPQMLLAVRFQPGATMADIGGLLTRLHLRVIDGPDADNTLRVTVPAAHVAAVLDALRAAPEVQSAQRFLPAQ